jgi:DNA-binding transcriptional MerR regulator
MGRTDRSLECGDTQHYYIGRGLLPPSLVGGRGACYGEEHLEGLSRIRARQEQGQTLAQIVWPLVYKTENGAEMGDLHMSLIHTCELNGVNPFEYLLIELQKHAEELTQHPADWMPWNYRQALPQAGTSQPPLQ